MLSLHKCQCGCNQEINLRFRYVKGHHLRNKKSNNYKNGSYISNGYKYILKHGYHPINKKGYVREHILVFQEFYKCCLLKWGNIHHQDGNRANNEISNLIGMMKSIHLRNHMIGNKYCLINKSNRICLVCNSKTTYIDKKGYHRWYKYKEGFKCSRCRDLEYNDLKKNMNL